MAERILIIKQGALGDIVLSLGRMQALRELHPDAHFTMLTMGIFAPFMQGTGIFDDILIDNRKSFLHIAELARTISGLVKGRFDIIYNMQLTERNRYYFRLMRLFSPAGDWDWYEYYGDQSRHRIHKTGFLGCGTEEITKWNPPSRRTDLSEVHGEGKHFDLLPAHYVLMIPGCSPQHTYKRWPVAHYREIVRRLEQRGISVVLLGTKAEEREAQEIGRGFSGVVSMIGLTSLADIPQVARRALAVIGNDTGTSHMASLAGANTIAIFDHRNAESILCGPNSVSLVSDAGVELITPDRVWEHLEPKLKQSFH